MSQCALATNRSRVSLRSSGNALVIAIALAAIGALTSAGSMLASESSPEMEVTAAWIRWLPADLPAGGYLTLHNRASHPVTLISVSSPNYAQVSLHRSVNQGGTSTMQPVHEIHLRAGESVNFAAGGYHLMLESPTNAVHPGDHVPITLHFAGGSSMTVSFEVRQPDS